mgnify:CR=1 FL=1
MGSFYLIGVQETGEEIVMKELDRVANALLSDSDDEDLCWIMFNDYVGRLIDKYKNMDSGELMSNLLSEAGKLKSEGKLNSDTLSTLKSTLSPFLNDGQNQMLNSLINAINEQK